MKISLTLQKFALNIKKKKWKKISPGLKKSILITNESLRVLLLLLMVWCGSGDGGTDIKEKAVGSVCPVWMKDARCRDAVYKAGDHISPCPYY